MPFWLNVIGRLPRFAISGRWWWNRVCAQCGRRCESCVFCVEEVVGFGTNLFNERATYSHDDGYVTGAVRRVRASRRRWGSGYPYRSNVGAPSPFNYSAGAQVRLVIYKTANFNYGCLGAACSRGKGCNSYGGCSSRSSSPLHRTTPRGGSI